jgi:hypothetical protein
MPTAPVLTAPASIQAGTCTTYDDLEALMRIVFGNGSPNVNSGIAKLKQVKKKLEKNDAAGAQDHAKNLIRFLQQKANDLPGRDRVQELISKIECYAGLSGDSFLVYPSDQPQTFVSNSGAAGLQLPANPVSEPTLITVTVLPMNSSGVLDTKLDKYPGFVEVTQESGVPNSLVKPVVVGVCPIAGIPAAVRDRLVLGHQKTSGFEIAPVADASFLDCSNVVGSADNANKLPGWLQSLADLVLPKTLHAAVRTMMFAGGVGGTVTEFSPFGPVDPQLSFSGGVGGTVTEFIRVPSDGSATPAPKPKGSASTGTATMVAAGSQASLETAALATAAECAVGTVGTAVAVECRPRVTITTANGTILTGVPVSFAIGLGGGTTAIDNPTTRACGPFGSMSSTTTNVNGKAGACWTLGAEAGTNTLIATASPGGDAPPGVFFTPENSTFTVTANKAAATIALSGLSQTYTGSPISVTAATTPSGLSTVNITYDGSASAPTNAGSYAVVATLDNPSYAGTASGTLVIGPASQAPLVATGPEALAFGATPVQLGTTGGNGAGTVSFNAGGSTACAVTASGLLTMTSGTGTCAVTATKAADANYTSVTSDPLSISPAKATASIALSDLSYSYDGSPKSATATTTPGGLSGVMVTYDGSSSLPVNAGSYAVVASLSNANYSATNATATLTISAAAQAPLAVTGANSITFNGGPSTLGASGGSSTGAVTFDAGTSTACSVTALGAVTATSGTGTCDITAIKASDANYIAVTSPPFSITVNKASAAIALSGLNVTYDGSPKNAVVTVTPSVPGLAVTYEGGTAAPANAGSYAVLATLTNADYAAAPASGTLVIAKAGQAAFTVSAPASATYGAGLAQAIASGGSGGGAVTYDASTTPGACTVNATSGVVTILKGTGTCVVSATKAGDNNYNSTTASPASITLTRAGQSISFGSLSGKTYGDAAFNLSATATSGLAVSFSAGAGSQCSVSGATVTLTGAGSCVITAMQPGNADYYNAATPVQQSFTIARRGATATAGSGSMLFGAAVPSLPCSVNGLLVPDAASVTCTTIVPTITTKGTYVTTPNVSPASPANYLVGPVNGMLTVLGYVQQGCFASPLSGTGASSASQVSRGTSVKVKCRLVEPGSGRPIVTAKGNLLVENMGSNGASSQGTVFSGTNVFTVYDDHDYSNDDGFYTYDLSTSSLTKGNYYRVTATWDDGSTTVGWFKVKSY